MSAQLSTGLRNAMLGGSSLKTALALGKINIYSGTVPASADAALTGTLLTTITVASGATGISLAAAASGGSIAKATEVWSGLNVAGGTATHFRYVAPGDDGTLSTTQARIQGLCATAGADLNMSSVNLTAGATQTVDSGNIVLPTY